MRNFVQPGRILTIPAPVAIVSGEVVITGDIKGVAAGSAASGAPVDVETEGVFDLPKVGANSFGLGAKVYYDTATKLCTTTSSGNTLLGVAVAVAGSGLATVKVRLSGF